MFSKDDIIVLKEKHDLPDEKLKELLESGVYDIFLFKNADAVRRKYYGTDVYIRGLIEFTNYCKNDCLYCGIRRSNNKCERYRLTKEEIMDCCQNGYRLGLRTFVLQGGEDPYFSDDRIEDIVSCIRKTYPDCAITLSIGERDRESYEKFFLAGANRFLLRHETADDCHYSKLHPTQMSLIKRKECLFYLKAIGYQVGSGFMVGSPYQTTENLIQDLRFLQELQPDMIGIGPFIKHSQTPFKNFENGQAQLTLRLIAVLRLMFPKALIPSTTALSTADENGRKLGLKAGANVIMPNISPYNIRKKYEIYEKKVFSGQEDASFLDFIKKDIEKIGYNIVVNIGNVVK